MTTTVIALQAVTSQVTYDTFGNLFATYDDTPEIAYDSPFWQAGAPVLAVIRSDEILYTLTGVSSSSGFTTGWYGSDDAVSLCDRLKIRYGIKPETVSVSTRTCMELGATTSSGTAYENSAGWHDLLQSARWHQFVASFTGNVEIEQVTPRLKADSDE